jgi:HAD superfamily hydrolase (TIGR01509 family)
MSYRAIALDLGGVLLDSEDAHESAARQVAAKHGLHVPSDAWRRIRGGAYENFFDYLLSLAENAGRGVLPFQAVMQAYDCYYEEAHRSSRLFPGALELLQAARRMFAFVAVATSSEWRLVDASLRHFGIARYLDGVVSGDHITQKKPAPETFLVTAWLLGVKPRSMIVVEDSTHGIRGARLARAHVIGIATNRDAETLRAAKAHHVARDHSELMEYLRALSEAGRIAGRGM